MASTTLTNLPTVIGLLGTEPLLGVQNGTSVQITTGQIVSLAVSGLGTSTPLTVGNGGTGDNTLPAYGLLYGNGTAPIGSISQPAGANYVLVGSPGSAPTWQPTIPVTAGVDSVAFGTTGLTPTAATAGVVSVAFGTVPTAAGIYSPATNQIALSTNSVQRFLIDASGNSTLSGTTTAPFYIANGTISGSLSQGAYAYGTLPYSDTNIFASYQTSVNSYSQLLLHNSSSGTTASTDVIVGNNNTTSTTYYGDFGMNSSGFTGTGSLNGANNVFLTSTTADLVVGTTTSNAIRFVVNGATTDTITLPSTGNLFQADFTNATLTSRLSFQTSTANSTTGIYALPNGTSTAASWQATNNSTPTNASKILIATNGTTDVQLVSGINGTGTYLPLSFYTNGSGQFAINTSGAWGIGSVAAATVNYGTSGQAFISGGNAAQPTWGTLQVNGGGTGATTFTANGVLYGNTTSALGVTAAGTTGQVLIGNTGAAPSWSSTPSLGAVTITSTSANALAVGPAGTTNPTFNVDASTTSAATGFNVKSAAAGSGVALSALSSGANENLTLNAKGSGTISLASVSTGNIIIGSGDASATPVGIVLRSPNGTGTNITGGNLSLYSGNGTGTGGSGYIDFQVAAVGTTGSTANTLASALRILNSGFVGIGTTSPGASLVITPTTLGTAGTANKIRLYDSASVVYGFGVSSSSLDIIAGSTGGINFFVNGSGTSSVSIASTGGLTAATSVASPLVIGGTTASSTLTLESTSGAGTTDSIQFKVASQAEVARYDTSGAYFFKRVANAVNATATLTVAQLQGGIITSTTAAAVTMTMPTGTVLDTAGTGLAATTLATNETIQFTIKNTGATNAITVAVATGITNGGVAGDLTIAASATATYQLTKTGTNTFVLYKQ